MVLGAAVPAFDVDTPTYTVAYGTSSTSLFLRVHGALSSIASETRSGQFIVNTVPDHVVDVAFTGNATSVATVTHDNLELIVG